MIDLNLDNKSILGVYLLNLIKVINADLINQYSPN